MTVDEVVTIADATLRPALGEANVERIVVREDDDWSGDPSLFIDVFVDPRFGTPDLGRWLAARLSFSDRLTARGERRFPFVSLTDSQEEAKASEARYVDR